MNFSKYSRLEAQILKRLGQQSGGCCIQWSSKREMTLILTLGASEAHLHSSLAAKHSLESSELMKCRKQLLLPKVVG